MNFKNIGIKLSFLFHKYEWICAYRVNKNKIFNSHGKISDLKKIKVPKGFWASDPFLFEEGGEVFLFVEYCNKKKNKCVLAVKRILPEEEELFHFIYEFPWHTSYPCVFEWNDRKYIIPETKSARQIILLECTEWPYEWKKKCVLLDNVDAADSTPFILKEKLYLLIYEQNKRIRLSMAELDVENGKLSDIKLLKECTENTVRPGGHMIYNGNQNIFVRQPGIKFYGEKLEFVCYDLESEVFIEKVVYEIIPSQLEIEADGKIIGVHTYNSVGDVEVIDIFVKKLALLKPFIYILHRLRICGYGEYEKDKKFIWKECI